MSFYDEDRELEEEREPRTLPDFFIEIDAICGVCKIKNSLERPLKWVCSGCGEPTHTECGADTEPSGDWDRDYDINYWMCNTCLEEYATEMRTQELLNWQRIYSWTEQKEPNTVVGESCTNILCPIAQYLNEQTDRQGWSVGPAIKYGDERLNKAEWVNTLIEKTDETTSKQRGPITREQFLTVLEQVKPEVNEELATASVGSDGDSLDDCLF